MFKKRKGKQPEPQPEKKELEKQVVAPKSEAKREVIIPRTEPKRKPKPVAKTLPPDPEAEARELILSMSDFPMRHNSEGACEDHDGKEDRRKCLPHDWRRTDKAD